MLAMACHVHRYPEMESNAWSMAVSDKLIILVGSEYASTLHAAPYAMQWGESHGFVHKLTKPTLENFAPCANVDLNYLAGARASTLALATTHAGSARTSTRHPYHPFGVQWVVGQLGVLDHAAGTA